MKTADDDAQHGDFDLAEARSVLSRTPGVLRALLDGLPEPWLRTRERDAAWTPLEVVGHLVEAERALWIPRLRCILERGEEATFPAFDRDAHLRVHAEAGLPELLDAFEERRGESLAALAAAGVTPEALARRGRHPEFGSVTLAQLLSTWVVHDLAHSRQVLRSMAKRYRDAVGPWRQYLRVMEE